MICPLNIDKYGERPYCHSSCVFYDNGCLIAKALEVYIKINSPFMAYNDESFGRNSNEKNNCDVFLV